MFYTKLFSGLAGLLLLLCLAGCKPQQASQPPNIIFLLTDDQRWDALGAMGNPIIQTPHMDALAREGLLFTNAYVTTPICCTSRASILSGQYARRHGIHDFKTSFSPAAWQACYPMQLKQAGYYLGFVGKFGVGRGEDMPAADFDYWKGIPGQPQYEQRDEQGRYKHLTRIMGEQCLEFLQQAPADRPFCLSVSFKAPHVQDADPRQFLYDSAYQELFEEVQIPPARAGTDEYWEAFPEFFKADNEARRRWEMRFSTPEKYQASVKGYYRLIYGVDVVIGNIRKELARLGMDEHTLIVLMGDNGFFLGEKGLAGKWYIYEESIRVPLVWYDPRLPQEQRGKKIDQIALNIDIAPTLLKVAGQDIPSQMQGQDLYSLLNHSQTEWRQDFLFEHLFEHPRIPKSEGVVSLFEKYARYLPPAPPYEEFYDLRTDPGELENLAGKPEAEKRVEQARKRLQTLIGQFQ